MTSANDDLHYGCILVVDDDPTVRLLCRETLQQVGYEVVEAGDGGEAITLLQTVRPDLILLDVMMPGVDGFETLRHVRGSTRCERIPVVMVTGLEDTESIQLAYQEGATDFITKPLSWVILRHRVQYILRASRNHDALHRSQEELATSQRIARVGGWEWDVEADRLTTSETTREVFGLGEAGFGRTLDDFIRHVHEEDRHEIRRFIQEAVRDNGTFRVDHRLVSDEGERFVTSHGEVVRREATTPILCATIQDVTERKVAQEQARYLSLFDSLTGLPNRTMFKEHIGQALQLVQRQGAFFALMFVDIDRFKRINDTLGHNVGDRLLKLIAERLVECVRKSDSIGVTRSVMDNAVSRLGGDDFMILLTNLREPQDAVKAARRVIEAVSRPIDLAAQDLVVTASIGISFSPHDGEDAETLLKNADIAMHAAKHEGGNGITFYDRSLNDRAFERLSLEGDLRKALENEDLHVVYQPKISLVTGEISGAEALVRWDHPTRGALSPEEFVSLAEESGLIGRLGEWVLQRACMAAVAWRDATRPVKVAVNLSGVQFRQKDLAARIRGLLDETGASPDLLDLEITENVIMESVAGTVRRLHELEALGLTLTIDDFGTGYSSLSYLKTFPVDTLKIDQTFIRDMTRDPGDAALARAIIEMGHGLSLGVIAEGVETVEQLDFLREAGCDEMQGYLFAEPVSEAAFGDLLKRGARLDRIRRVA